MNRNLSGKIVLITGAARGIGAETARKVAARGARVSLVGMEPERLEALARELGPEHAFFACDVTSQRALESAVAGTQRALGGIDVVVANAGIANNGTVATNSVEALARTIEVNLTGVIRTVSATLAEVTARRGYYLLVSSAAAIHALPGMSAYAASKIGVEHFGSALRLEVAHKGVAVGVAHPGWIDTDMVRDTKEDLPTFRELLRKLPGPFGTMTRVEDCAEAFALAIERRQRKLYVPGSLAIAAGLRTLFWSSFAERLLARDAERTVPNLERDVAAVGRHFGRQSVETAGPRPAAGE